jgi:hypothetical protein
VHVTHTLNVTSMNSPRKLMAKLFTDFFFLAARAASSGLSGIWDPATGSYPVGAEVGFSNNYMTSGWSCSSTGSGAGQYNQCTKSGQSAVPNLISAKSYIGQMLDPQFTNDQGHAAGPVGDLQEQGMTILCAIGKLATSFDTDGTPSVGTQNITFPSSQTDTIYQAMSSNGCGLAYQQSLAGQTFAATITAVSSANYTKQISLNLSGDSVTIWIGLNLAAGNLYLMQLNDQSGAGSNYAMRSIFAGTGLNSAATSKILFEYGNMGYPLTRNGGASCYSSGQWQCTFVFERLFIDSGHDVAYVISNRGYPGDSSGSLNNAPTYYTQLFGAGKPNEIGACTSASCTTTIALSMAASGASMANGSSASLSGDYNACVLAYDRSITTDNSLTCDLTGTTVNGGSSTGVIELSRQFYAGMTNNIPNVVANTNSSTALSFTDGSTIFSTATSQ